MNELSFYLDWYKREEDFTNNIENSLNIPIIVLSGIFVFAAYMLQSFGFETSNYITKLFFIILISVTAISWFVVIYYLFKAYARIFKQLDYKYLSFPESLNKWFLKIEEQCEEENANKDDEIERLLKIEIIKHLENNVKINDSRALSLHFAKRILFICFIIVIITSIPYLFNYFN